MTSTLQKGRLNLFVIHKVYITLISQTQIRQKYSAMTINKQYEGCSKHQFKGAINACHLKGMIGHFSQCEFEMVHEKMIQNCPVILHNVTNAYKIFGPDPVGLRGKTVQRQPVRIQPESVQISTEIIEQNKLVILIADIIFVNQIPFIITCG